MECFRWDFMYKVRLFSVTLREHTREHIGLETKQAIV